MDIVTLKCDAFVLRDQGVYFVSDIKDILHCEYIESISRGEKINFFGIGGGLYCFKISDGSEFVLMNRQEMEYFIEEKDVFYLYLKYGTVGDADEEKYMNLHVPKS